MFRPISGEAIIIYCYLPYAMGNGTITEMYKLKRRGEASKNEIKKERGTFSPRKHTRKHKRPTTGCRKEGFRKRAGRTHKRNLHHSG